MALDADAEGDEEVLLVNNETHQKPSRRYSTVLIVGLAFLAGIGAIVLFQTVAPEDKEKGVKSPAALARSFLGAAFDRPSIGSSVIQKKIKPSVFAHIDEMMKGVPDLEGLIDGPLSTAVGLITDGNGFTMKDLAIDVGLATLTMVNPLLGGAATLVYTLFKSMFSESKPDPTEIKILKKAQQMMETEDLKAKMKDVQNHLLGVEEELAWMPDMLKDDNVDSFTYMQIVLHDLNVYKRDVFGKECFDTLDLKPATSKLPTAECKEWQNLGTAVPGLLYANLHLNVLVEVARQKKIYRQTVSDQIKELGSKYVVLLRSASNTYKTKATAETKTLAKMGYLSDRTAFYNYCYFGWDKGKNLAKWVWENCPDVSDKTKYTCESKDFGFSCWDYDSKFPRSAGSGGVGKYVDKCLREFETDKVQLWKDGVDKPIAAMEKTVLAAFIGSKKFTKISEDFKDKECEIPKEGTEDSDDSVEDFYDALGGGGYVEAGCQLFCMRTKWCNYVAFSNTGYCHIFATCDTKSDGPAIWTIFQRPEAAPFDSKRPR